MLCIMYPVPCAMCHVRFLHLAVLPWWCRLLCQHRWLLLQFGHDIWPLRRRAGSWWVHVWDGNWIGRKQRQVLVGIFSILVPICSTSPRKHHGWELFLQSNRTPTSSTLWKGEIPWIALPTSIYFSVSVLRPPWVWDSQVDAPRGRSVSLNT